MANANDNTTLNAPGTVGGDVISTEDQPAGAQRGDPALPVTDYKLPRSKIVTGAYDVDGGDVTAQNPFPVESRRERQYAESAYLRQIDSQRIQYVTRSRERVNIQFFNRGER